MKHFRIAVNGTSYDVEVTELDGAVSAAAAAMAQGKSDEEVALLAAIFAQPCDDRRSARAKKAAAARRNKGISPWPPLLCLRPFCRPG